MAGPARPGRDGYHTVWQTARRIGSGTSSTRTGSWRGNGQAVLDFFRPNDGQPGGRRWRPKSGGWLLPPADPRHLGIVAEEDVTWVQPKLCLSPSGL